MMSKNEPSPSEVPRKRLFRSTAMVETDDYRKWRESIQAGHKKIDALEKQVNEMINKAIADTALRAALPALEAVADRTEAQQRRAAKVQAVKLYENAVEQLGTTRPGSYQAQQAWTIIKQAIESEPVLKRREQQRRAEAAALERQRHGNPAHVQRERQR